MTPSARNKGNYAAGSVSGHMLRLALPIFLAELVHVLYNIVDRIFIGHIPGEGTLALSGVGVVFPLISFINAFAGLFGSGGAPLCSIARGEGNEEKAQRILETAFTMLILIGLVLAAVMLSFLDPVLYAMGADASTISYAHDYFSIYLLGTVFVLISLGGNPYINMQGNSMVGMFTVMIGAALNIILDPLFIFLFGLGIKGAALATVLSQGASALWVTLFLTGRKASVRIRRLHVDLSLLKDMLKLGLSGFMFKMTNSITQAVANITLRLFGGPLGTLYIGAMSIINSMREVTGLPIQAISNSAQPVIGYNYGAKENRRVAKAIVNLTVYALGYGLVAWALVMVFPGLLVNLFTPDESLASLTIPCARIFFGAFFMMSLQSAGQNTFVALNCPKRAVFFSLLRKVVLVTPLTLLLPRIGFGVDGVFIAEMLSQLIGAACTYITMMATIFRKVRRTPDGVKVLV